MNRATGTNPVRATTLPTDKCLKTLLFRGKKKPSRGQTTVEFALICLPFFCILFAIVDYAQIYFYENSLQNAMREAARFATAGSIIEASSNGMTVYETNSGGIVVPKAINDTEGREASRNECIRYWFLSNCVIQIPLSNIMIVSAPTLPGVPPVTSTNSLGKLTLLSGYSVTTNPITSGVSTNPVAAIKGPGEANDYIQVSAIYTIKTITPLFSYLGGYSRQGWYSYPVYVSAIVKNEPALLNFQHTNIYSDEP